MVAHIEERRSTPGSDSPGRSLGALAAGLLVVAAFLLHVGQLAGPFTDGQSGNCGAMFALFARNAEALGWSQTWGVPVVNPVAPSVVDEAIFYTHHPPGLAWLVQLSGRIAPEVETGARIVALLLTLAAALLAADLLARLSGRTAGLVAGLLLLGLPAGHHHGLLVNYETAAVPGLLLLVRALVLSRGAPLAAGALAALLDIGALWPLALAWIRSPRGRWWRAVGGASLVLVSLAVLHRARAPASLAETLGQALGTTALSPAFSAAAWVRAAAVDLPTLYGVGLLLAPIGLVLTTRAIRRPLVLLAGSGLANVVVFAQHATGHEHFWLLLAPFVAVGSAAALVPVGAGPGRRRLGLGLAAVVLAVSALQAVDEYDVRRRTSQVDRATAFAAVTDTESVHVFPGGVPLVFLQRAARHVVAFSVTDARSARQVAASYAALVGAHDAPVLVVVPAGEPAPTWVESLGPGETRGGFVFRELPVGD